MRLNPPQVQRVLLALLICLGGALRVANLDDAIERTPDERTYTRQAIVWLQSGQAGLQSLVAEFKREPHANYYPPPTRVGMIRSVAAVMQWTGRYDESAGTLVSCAASIASLFVVALIGIRFFPVWATVIAVLFLAVFPGSLAIAQRTWADSIVELVGLLLVWLMCEINRDSQRRLWYVVFAAIGSVAIVVKEAALLPYGLCGLWLLWVLLRRGEWKNALFLVSVGTVGLVASLVWLAGQVGSLSDLIYIVSGIKSANAANPYALEYASGPGYLLLQGFWLLSPALALLALGGVFVALRPQTKIDVNAQPVLACALVALVQVLIAMLLPHWLNLRYVAAAFGPICLLAGLGGWHAFLLLRRWLGGSKPVLVATAFVAILLLSAAGDYRRFKRVFVNGQAADLSVKMLRDAASR